jgi:hypothetical protein
VDTGDDVRPREIQQVRVAGDVARMVAETLAAVGLLAAHLALDQTPQEPSSTAIRLRRIASRLWRTSGIRLALGRPEDPGAKGSLTAL